MLSKKYLVVPSTKTLQQTMNTKALASILFYTKIVFLFSGRRVEGFLSDWCNKVQARVHQHMHITGKNVENDVAKYNELNGCEAFPADLTRRYAIISIGALMCPQLSNADEPSTIRIKSQSDLEDPLAAFGKSLQEMTFDNPSSGGISKEDPSSFSGSAVPSSSSSGDSVGGDLGKAIEQMKLEQKRRIDPRTHG